MTFDAIRKLGKNIGPLLETNFRFLIPLIIIIFVKIIAAVYLFKTLNMASADTYWMAGPKDHYGQNDIFKSVATQGIKWPFLFLGWDSAWYLSITAKGYIFSDQSFAFFPGLPIFSWLLNLIMQNPAYAMVIFSFVIGVLWIPVFQLVAEQYANKSTALAVTLLFASFPYVFLFTTVAYSEGLFLFFTLCAWYFFKKGKLLPSSLSTSVATLSRVPGLLILLPMLIEHIRKRPHPINSVAIRNISYFSIPFLSFFAWLLYCKILSNDWLAFMTRSAWTSMTSFRSLIFEILPTSGVQGFLDEIFKQWPFSFAWVPFVLVTPLLIYVVIKMEKSLAVYSTVYVLYILFLAGALDSIPRLFSFCFPMWLATGLMFFKGKKSKFAIPAIFALFCAVGVFLWLNFLDGIFIA